MAAPAPRSLADALRTFDDDALADLLRRRPDLVRPVPTDMTALAARATSGPSVARCLDGLDALTLHVLRTTATSGDGVSSRTVIERAAAPLGPDAATACGVAIDDLVALGLVWGTRTRLHVVLPAREQVADGPVPAWPRPELPVGSTVARADQVDALAAVHAREAVGLVRDLLDDWSAHPPGVLRSGALSLRDFAAARGRLHADWGRTALTIELAHAALLVADDEDEPPHWVPTDQYDTWLSKPSGEQWIDLVEAWLSLPRLPSLADERTQVLSADRDRRAVAALRRDTLALLATAPAGATLDPAAIETVLDDREPRRAGELRRLTVAATLREAEDLGLSGAGALSAAGRLLVSATDPAARRAVVAALAAALPDDIDHVLVQADLTIVAPGPLAPEASRRLRMVADVESRGHATVYRVTEASIRRSLDAGWDAAAIHGLLAELSHTPVPQPLTYLVDDVARRHGAVRVGPALSYIRSDDPDALAALVADRRLRALGLRQIADTVVVCQAPTSEVLGALRGAGLAPAAEGPDGAVVVRRPDERRIRTPKPAAVETRRQSPDRLIAAAVRTLRAADAAGRVTAPVTGPAATLVMHPQSASAVVGALRAALADTRAVWLGYAGTDGVITTQVVDPIRLHGGILVAFDHRTDTVRDFAVSRVTAVADA